LFKETKADVFGLSSIEIEKETGRFQDLCIRERLLHRPAVHYQGRIHETTVLADGGHPRSVLLEKYAMVHTGYSKSVALQKIKRNLDILEEEQKSLEDPLKRYLNAIYIMRESFFFKDLYKACDYCQYVLAHHELLDEAIEFSPMGFVRHFYHAADVIGLKRDKFNRKEVYDKLFKVIKERFPGSRDSLLAELHYQIRFEYREDRFLREVEEVEPKLPLEFSMEIPDRRSIEARIFELAAEAAHIRGDRRATCLYAYRSLECFPEFDCRPLLLLLYSLKDHFLEDVKTILYSAAIVGRPDIAGAVITILESKDYRRQLFDNAEMPESLMPKARYTSAVGVMEHDKVQHFRVKAERGIASMRYEDIVNDPDADFAAMEDYISAFYYAYALLMQEEYEKAYDIAAPHVKRGLTNQELLSVILVAAEKTREPLASEARKL
jgi:hypothetical protein